MYLRRTAACAAIQKKLATEKWVTSLLSIACGTSHDGKEGFIHSFIHSFVRSFVRSFVHSFIHTFVRSFVHSFIHSFIHTFIHSCIHSYIHSFIHSFHSFIHAFILSFIHSLIHLFIHLRVRSTSVVECLLMVRWIVRSIPHGGPIELFLIPASASELV